MSYTATLLAIWRSGAIAVPLHVQAPNAAVQYVLEDSSVRFLLADESAAAQLSALATEHNISFLNVDEIIKKQSFLEIKKLPELEIDADALIIYTSGTTGKPKGVVTTHRIIEAQLTMLITAWEWEQNDRILNVLPLHHVHGLVNALLCPLAAGATVFFLPKFDTADIWNLFKSGEINVFMAVPTIYVKLIADYEAADDSEKAQRTKALNQFRLMVSGSAALPTQVLETWKQISGHILLERYGMTEIGMAISNPYRGERRAGFVGLALPGVSLRLYDETTKTVLTREEEAGEIQVKGPAVFRCYWGKPEATAEAFSEDGWFRTGDMAILQNSYYKILGRLSTDIIKSGGYKLSALEIEEVLREHPDVKDCAVLALPDEEWGERVAVCIIPTDSALVDNLDKTLATWLRTQIAPYKIPRNWLFLKDFPRNALGKVLKNELKKLF
jgi:malonyl-CoA/methylmalonyl-CoA synthetase